MAGSARRIVVEFIGDGSSLNKELGSLQGKTSKFGDFMRKAGRVAAVGLAVAGAAAVKLGVDSVQAASDAEQSMGATETVFGKFADTVVADSNRAAKQFGLSASEYRVNANLIGSLFKNQGVATDELAAKSREMIGTASDLAATFGGSTKEAVEALGSAFKGEYDPLERYGISLKASTVSTEAMRLANAKSATEFGKLSIAQQTAFKQQAASNLIMAQSADSAGAFSRESETLAHKQQVLAAQFENVKVKVGNALLPVMSDLMDLIAEKIVPAVNDFIIGMKEGTGAGGKFADALGKIWAAAKKAWSILQPLIMFVVDNRAAFATFAGVILTVVAAVKIWRAAQMLLNAVLAANPIGIVIVAVALLAAGLVMAYRKSETFRNIVNGAFQAVRGGVNALVDVVQNAVARWNDRWDNAVATVRAIPGIIRGIFSGIGSALYGAGVELIAGLIRGITDKISDLKNKLAEVTDIIPDWKGPEERDRVLLKPAGQAIMGGLVSGIEDSRGLLQRALAGVTDDIANQHFEAAGLTVDHRVSEPMTQRAARDQQASAFMAALDRWADSRDEQTVFQFQIGGRTIQMSLLELKRHNGGLPLGLA